MRYTLNWAESAVADLARIWTTITEEFKDEVREAAERIDQELAWNAHLKGRECDGDRMLRVHPLMVFFRVDVANRTVDVLQLDLNP